MKSYFKRFWSGWICLTNLYFSQTAYITDSSYFEPISEFYYFKDTSYHHYKFVDTSIIHFQYSLPFYFNGQVGTAQPDYLFQQTNKTIGNRILSCYFPDILEKEQITIYKTRGFYSKLEGIAGSKDEQHFKSIFISPIKQKHQINFYFRRSTNTGFYLNQKASVTNVLVDYHHFGNKRISMDATILLNYIKHQENGGITKDTLSYTDLFLDKSLIPVNLPNARKIIRSNQAEYHLNYLIRKDSIIPQSISSGIVAHQFIYQYQDNLPLSGFYPFIFLDTLKTNDSLHSLKLNLPISYSVRYKKIYVQLEYNYEWNKIYLFSDTLIQNHHARLKIERNFNLFDKIKTKIGIEIQYILYGTQKDNYLGNLYIQSQYKKAIFTISANLSRQAPAFQQNYWYSNHFIWNNRFKDIVKQKFSAYIQHSSGFKLAYHLHFFKNYIYYINQYPQAYNNILNVHQIYLNIDKVFFKHLGWNAHYYYQWKNSNIVALPTHFLSSDIYYQGRWFHQNLLVNTGFQYITTFHYFDTYQYIPATGIYSLHLNNIQAVNYPQLSIYFAGRIKPVNFFIRIENVLAGLYPKPYYFVPNYMMPDRAFRMGISWMFFD